MDYDTLIISGGGSNGVVVLGYLHSKFKHGGIDQIKNFGGTSIGAVICWFLLIGYTPYELGVKLYTSPMWQKLKRNYFNLLSSQGLYNSDVLKSELLRLTIEKLGYSPRFEQLKVNFVCPAYNLTQDRVFYFDNVSFPKLQVIDALVYTCAIPFMFNPVFFEGDKMADGGVVDNFPIARVYATFNPKKTLAIKIAKRSTPTIVESLKWTFNDFKKLLSAMNGEQAGHYNNCETVNIDSRLKFYQITLTQDQIAQLFCEGHTI